MNALIGTVLLLEYPEWLETGSALVHLLAIQAALVAPLIGGLIRPPPILHLRLAKPIDELVNHIPLGARTEHPGEARQQLRERAYLHDGIAGSPLRFSVGARTVPLEAIGC